MSNNPALKFCHWGPLTVLFIIKLVTWCMVHMASMWWPPHESLGGALHAAVFMSLAGATFYYFLQALLGGPGYVPCGWAPKNEEDKQSLQYCFQCKGFKAPRSHHCQRCGRCVMKMDHHCPWINGCVGHANHRYFILFLTFAVLGCFQASIVLSACVYRGLTRPPRTPRPAAVPMVRLTLLTLLLALLAIGVAVGVVLAVGTLLYLQVRGILRNRTTIEDWIVEKADGRREDHNSEPFVFPYDLGWKENFKIVMMRSNLDGIQWPLRPGCGEYDLTREQLLQKVDKRRRARTFRAARVYSGAVVPVWEWPRAALAPPCTGEPRLSLSPGDSLRVTRHRRQWLFGEKLTEEEDGARGPRGWFPRAAADPITMEKPKPD